MQPADVHELFTTTKQLSTTYLGTRDSPLDVTEHVTLDAEARMTHVLSVGPTGYGKTQMLLHAALQDAYQGRGLCIVNPKGDAIAEFLQRLPEQRHDDIIYINPGREEVTPINVLEPHATPEMTPAQRENQKEIIVSDLIDLFRRYSENWGDRFGRVLETLLRAHIDLNLRDGDKTLLDVFQCVVTDDELTDLIDQTEDQVVREQLVRVKEDMGSYEMEPLQRRLNDFVMNPTIRRFIAAAESGIDFRKAVNDQKIILVDVQKGDVGDTVATLVGSIVITKIWAAAQSRITLPEPERTPFMLFVDELQNFGGEGSNFTKILSEAREYRLGCWLATQYLQQLAREMRRAVANNCRTKIVFNPAGSEDLSFVTGMLQGVDRTTVTALGKYRAVVQPPNEQQHRNAVVFDTYPPVPAIQDRETGTRLMDRGTYPQPIADTEFGGTSLGQGMNAGGDQHTQLLQAAEQYFEDAGFTVTLLYQDSGADRPDGHIQLGDDLAHLEAEVSTLSKPAKVLENWHRAARNDANCVFVVNQGEAATLAAILSDPVNRRGTDHEDNDGTYSYYASEDGPFGAVDELTTDWRIFEVIDTDAGTLEEHDPETGVQCPEEIAEPAEAEFCYYLDADGYCTQLDRPCVVMADDE